MYSRWPSYPGPTLTGAKLEQVAPSHLHCCFFCLLQVKDMFDIAKIDSEEDGITIDEFASVLHAKGYFVCQ